MELGWGTREETGAGVHGMAPALHPPYLLTLELGRHFGVLGAQLLLGPAHGLLLLGQVLDPLGLLIGQHLRCFGTVLLPTFSVLGENKREPSWGAFSVTVLAPYWPDALREQPTAFRSRRKASRFAMAFSACCFIIAWRRSAAWRASARRFRMSATRCCSCAAAMRARLPMKRRRDGESDGGLNVNVASSRPACLSGWDEERGVRTNAWC